MKCDYCAVARMAKGRADGNPRKRLITTVFVLFIVGGLVYLYSRNSGSLSSIEYTSKSLDTGGGDNIVVPRTIPVSYLNPN